MTFEHDGVVYKNRRAFYKEMHPHLDAEAVSSVLQNDIDRFLYHNIPSYRDKKRYNNKYRKDRPLVRFYTKFCDTPIKELFQIGRAHV